MKIKKVRKLNEKLKKAIRDLEEECKKTDNTRSVVSFDTDIEEEDTFNSFYLAYQGRQLIGFLSLFFTDEKSVEVCAFVHPNFRRNGYFKKMYAKAHLEIDKMGIQEIVFIHEPMSQVATLVLKSMNAGYLYSEYLLSFVYTPIKLSKESGANVKSNNMNNVKSNNINLESHEDMNLERAIEEDIPRIKEIYLDLFHDFNEEDTNYRLLETILNENCYLFKAMLKGVIIGFCSVIKEETYELIFDFAIAREYQGKGRGKELLSLVIEELSNKAGLNEKKIILHVSSYNNPAYHLYRNFGFEIIEQYDYYRVPRK